MNAQSPPPASPPPQEKFEDLIYAYIVIRDHIQARERELEEELEPRRAQLKILNEKLLLQLNATGQDSAKTKTGTAYRKSFVSVTVADKDAFRRHVIGTEDWDLIDWRANKTAVSKIVEEEQEPPPGVNFSKGYDVGVRRPGKDS